MKLKHLLPIAAMIAFAACSKDDKNPETAEDPATFDEIGTIDIGGAGAAEISAYDPATKRLFVVKNDGTNMIKILNLADPAHPVDLNQDVLTNSGAVNSLAVHNGKLAAAIEATDKTLPGRVVVYNTENMSVLKTIPTGALPDMVTFSPDGKFILTANEGEPATDYSADPIGTVSVISVDNNYSVVNLDFNGFAGQETALKAKGFRVFGPTGFAQNIEPEYITVAPDSKTAWVTLQENNAIAKIDLATKTITDIFPLGFKDYNTDANAVDLSDKDNTITFSKSPVKGMYQPDAVAVLQNGAGIPYLFTVNEGDVREWDAYAENVRIKDLQLDPTAFPNAAALKADAALGRLYVTKTLGDLNSDGLYESLYSFGARSFSVWNGNTGALVFDSKNELDVKVKETGIYEDGRSDDKSIEPEGITLGTMGNKTIAFVGMERVDAVAIYDVTSPAAPVFLKIVKSGDAPEGVLFVDAKNSPNKKSLLIVSSEDDGVIKIYAPKN
ncbi:choice-of-anchor I family protein [Chitinophaga barathri]|uniref:Alkaline phosphatase n=2 Tax=Chitinophaga barathri TaxID=1647451 RepID=A0A3N4MMT1_9BACT|nr:choice-of-anchor I family protein [Chitinophaga barathri]RPD43347.1 alkaline phosphatase [Chitinophaga barathri]